jgi:acyl dehydratase
MNAQNFESVSVGDVLPEHVSRPITRSTLALFAGGSGDHHPIHLDLEFAKKAGWPDVFAQGMLSMAFLAQLMTKWAPQDRLRSLSGRFVSITPVGAAVTCSGQVVAKREEAGEKRIVIAIKARIGDGIDTIIGEAIVALP